MDGMRQSTLERHLKRYHLEGECWIWNGSVLDNGYGQIRAGQKAHRFFYEHLVGPVPEGLVLDHLCRNKLCVNPDHLRPVTHQENSTNNAGAAAENFTKFRCKNGHEFSTENTFIDGQGHRQCTICSRKRWRENKANRR